MPDDDLARYLALLTAQHNQMPRFVKTVALSLRPLVDALALARRLEDLFNIDEAPGQQLDFLGRWIGLSRRIAIPRNDLFSWDTPDLGWDEGVWLSPWEGLTEAIILNDDQYRLVLKARILANNWDGTRDGAYNAWNFYFGEMGYQVLIDDEFDRPDWTGIGRCTGNMWMVVALVGPPPDRLLEALFAGGYFDLRPAGVGMGRLTTQTGPGTDDGHPLFGWDMGPEGPPVEFFHWDDDDEYRGWDNAEWYPFEPFMLDGTSEQGLDSGHWSMPDFARGSVPALASAAPPEPWIAGWDMGAWGKELPNMSYLYEQQLVEAA